GRDRRLRGRVVRAERRPGRGHHASRAGRAAGRRHLRPGRGHGPGRHRRCEGDRLVSVTIRRIGAAVLAVVFNVALVALASSGGSPASADPSTCDVPTIPGATDCTSTTTTTAPPATTSTTTTTTVPDTTSSIDTTTTVADSS